MKKLSDRTRSYTKNLLSVNEIHAFSKIAFDYCQEGTDKDR